MFGVLPAAGLYCRHLVGLDLRGLRFTGAGSDPRPALVADDLRGGRIDGLRVESVSGPGPTIWLEQARGVLLADAQAPEGTALFLRVTGERSEDVELSGGDLSAAAKAFELGPGVRADAVRRADPGA